MKNDFHSSTFYIKDKDKDVGNYTVFMIPFILNIVESKSAIKSSYYIDESYNILKHFKDLKENKNLKSKIINTAKLLMEKISNSFLDSVEKIQMIIDYMGKLIKIDFKPSTLLKTEKGYINKDEILINKKEKEKEKNYLSYLDKLSKKATDFSREINFSESTLANRSKDTIDIIEILAMSVIYSIINLQLIPFLDNIKSNMSENNNNSDYVINLSSLNQFFLKLFYLKKLINDSDLIKKYEELIKLYDFSIFSALTNNAVYEHITLGVGASSEVVLINYQYKFQCCMKSSKKISTSKYFIDSDKKLSWIKQEEDALNRLKSSKVIRPLDFLDLKFSRCLVLPVYPYGDLEININIFDKLRLAEINYFYMYYLLISENKQKQIDKKTSNTNTLKSSKVSQNQDNKNNTNEVISKSKINKFFDKPSKSLLMFYVHQFIEILTFLNNENCCHKDIKPLNVILSDDFNLILIDLQLSSIYDKDEKIKNLINTHGTANYQGTARYNDSDYVSSKTYSKYDIYSFGAILNNISNKCFPDEVFLNEAFDKKRNKDALEKNDIHYLRECFFSHFFRKMKLEEYKMTKNTEENNSFTGMITKNMKTNNLMIKSTYFPFLVTKMNEQHIFQFSNKIKRGQNQDDSSVSINDLSTLHTSEKSLKIIDSLQYTYKLNENYSNKLSNNFSILKLEEKKINNKESYKAFFHKQVNTQLEDLIYNMCNPDVRERYDISQILKHDYIKKNKVTYKKLIYYKKYFETLDLSFKQVDNPTIQDTIKRRANRKPIIEIQKFCLFNDMDKDEMLEDKYAYKREYLNNLMRLDLKSKVKSKVIASFKFKNFKNVNN